MITTNKGLADMAGIGGGGVEPFVLMEYNFLRYLVAEHAPDEAYGDNGIDWSLIRLARFNKNRGIYSFKGVNFLEVELLTPKETRKKGKIIMRSELLFKRIDNDFN